MSIISGFMMNAQSSTQSVDWMSCASQSDETLMTVEHAADVNNAPCAVCSENGSGFHYGVYTCEGCKVGFMV